VPGAYTASGTRLRRLPEDIMSVKPEVKESEAVVLCVQDVWMSIGLRWSAIRQELDADSLVSGTPSPPIALDDGRAPYELTLAAVSLQIRSIESLLPAGQAQRVRGLLLAHFVSAQGRGAISVLEAHDAAWREALARGHDPALGPALVMAQRLGYAPSDEVGPGSASPILERISAVLRRYGARDWWQRLVASSRLISDAADAADGGTLPEV
jgi:hypothetical protein